MRLIIHLLSVVRGSPPEQPLAVAATSEIASRQLLMFSFVAAFRQSLELLRLASVSHEVVRPKTATQQADSQDVAVGWLEWWHVPEAYPQKPRRL